MENAYFKSTDGHYNGWSFNLRRPNLHILPLIIRHDGYVHWSIIELNPMVSQRTTLTSFSRLIIVDSTRSGKRIPDALSKTVPIWCAVVNEATRMRHGPTNWLESGGLSTPRQAVSLQEHEQIKRLIYDWAKLLAVRKVFSSNGPNLLMVAST